MTPATERWARAGAFAVFVAIVARLTSRLRGHRPESAEPVVAEWPPLDDPPAVA